MKRYTAIHLTSLIICITLGGALAQLSPNLLGQDLGKGAKSGKFVRIDLESKEGIAIAEVEVFSKVTNIALTGKASQSTTYPHLPNVDASKAIDGNIIGDVFSGSVIHTEQIPDQWWEVDLGGVKRISGITIWPRTDGGRAVQKRLDGFVVSILDENRQAIWTRKFPKAPLKRLKIEFGVAGEDIDLDQYEPAKGAPPRNAVELAEFLHQTVWEISNRSTKNPGLYTLTLNKNGTFKHSDGRTGQLEFLSPREIRFWGVDPGALSIDGNQFGAVGGATTFFGRRKQFGSQVGRLPEFLSYLGPQATSVEAISEIHKKLVQAWGKK